MPATRDPGFYGTDSETYYVTSHGRVWCVGSDGLGPDAPWEVKPRLLPREAIAVDHLLTPEEMVAHLRRIEGVSGEHLISD
jgi:hypothetical protein